RRFSVFSGDTEFQSEFVIFAAPTFLAPYLIDGFSAGHDFEYSPWLTANLTLQKLPERYGPDLTWDNVVMNSPTLGYVDAMHQTIQSHVERTVWTFYWALAEESLPQIVAFCSRKIGITGRKPFCAISNGCTMI